MPNSGNTHGFIDWYEPVHKTISHLPEVREEIRDGANRLAHEAVFRLTAHRDEGDAAIEVIHRKMSNQFGPGPDLDSYVLLTATDHFKEGSPREKGWPAAMSIEKGATNGGGGVGPLWGAVDHLSKGVKQH